MKNKFHKLFLVVIGLLVLWLSTAATYYIDPANGSDANNGTNADASLGTNGPWQTIAKYMRTNGVSGDTAYLAPGVYRESVTVNITSPTATTKLIGDPQNTRGFKTSGGVRVAPAVCRATVFTNDSTASPATSVINLNGSDYWWFENIYFNAAGAGGAPVSATTTTSTNITFTNCVLNVVGASVQCISITAAFGVPLNLTISNCKLVNLVNAALVITHTSGSGSDWDLNVKIQNCEIVALGSSGISVAKSGSSANVGGGVLVTNCVFVGASSGFSCPATSTNNFTNYISGCLLFNSTGVTCGDASQITEDYNWFDCSVAPRSVAPVGTHSSSAFNPMIDFDSSRMWGFGPRPYFSPLTGSPIIGAGVSTGVVDLFGNARSVPNTIGAYRLYQNVETSSSLSQ